LPNILTPSALWYNFDDSLELSAITLGEKSDDQMRIEHFSFLGRDTGEGRVKIFGAYAYDKNHPSNANILVFNDSTKSIDENLMRYYVQNGYSVFMVDYRGEWRGAETYTVYPENVAYANTARCGRFKDYVDDSADKTSWYEWVAVGIYTVKYIKERTKNPDLAVVGIRDGGEIAWKLAAVTKLSCAVMVCAAGWKAYAGISKYRSDEQVLDEERYRFIAGIDSQSYAPLVKCPILMLCSTNDDRFDYDRAYDTFSRINPAYSSDSVISYSVYCDATIGVYSTVDMVMFLDKHLKHRQIFVAKPVEVTVCVDEEENLVARAVCDDEGEVEEVGMFMAEDCIDVALREWSECPLKKKINSREREFYLNIYEKTTTVFVFCYAKYSNGFSVWSKINVKKISGKFKNTQGWCRVLFSAKEGKDGFAIADPTSKAVGGIFFPRGVILPQIVTKAKGISGIYADGGITTYRFNSPKFSPAKGSVLKLDIFTDDSCEVEFSMYDVNTHETFRYIHNVVGGVWQALILESKMFKGASGTALSNYATNLRFSIICNKQYAINNVMWL
jgi:dienelactone hydrolase